MRQLLHTEWVSQSDLVLAKAGLLRCHTFVHSPLALPLRDICRQPEQPRVGATFKLQDLSEWPSCGRDLRERQQVAYDIAQTGNAGDTSQS